MLQVNQIVRVSAPFPKKQTASSHLNVVEHVLNSLFNNKEMLKYKKIWTITNIIVPPPPQAGIELWSLNLQSKVRFMRQSLDGE